MSIAKQLIDALSDKCVEAKMKHQSAMIRNKIRVKLNKKVDDKFVGWIKTLVTLWLVSKYQYI